MIRVIKDFEMGNRGIFNDNNSCFPGKTGGKTTKYVLVTTSSELLENEPSIYPCRCMSYTNESDVSLKLLNILLA